jgi:hypothetical protein
VLFLPVFLLVVNRALASLAIMTPQLLKDPNVFPDEVVLKKSLNRAYPAYEELVSATRSAGLEMTWRFYNDGKAWLCKVSYKKKTMFWLSVWDGLFKTSFYFTEKTRSGVMSLAIDKNVLAAFSDVKSTGKLVPLRMAIGKKSQVRDVMLLAGYKKSLK